MSELRKELRIITILLLTVISFYSVCAQDVYVCSTCSYTASNFTAALTLANNTDIYTIIINETGLYTINSTTTFNITDSGQNGTIVITASNVSFDCNSSVIDGNDDGGLGLIVSNANNVSIANCSFADYSTNYYVNHSTNVSIVNSQSQGSMNAGILIYDSDNNTLSGIVSSSEIFNAISIQDTNRTTVYSSNISSPGNDGIILDSSDNNLFISVIVLDAGADGINISNSDSNTFTDCFVNNSGESGLQISLSSGNTFTGNTFNNSLNDKMILDISSVSDCNQNFSGDGNTFDGKIIHFIYGETSGTPYTPTPGVEVGMLGVVSSSGITVSDFEVTGDLAWGVLICNSTGATLTNINVTGGPVTGIELYYSNSTNIEDCRVNGSQNNGIMVSYSHSNAFSGVISEDNVLSGIFFTSSSGNTINESSTIQGNTLKGVYLNYSNLTTVDSNTISDNIEEGVYLYDSDNLTISSNTITDNAVGINLTLSLGSIISLNTLSLNTLGELFMYQSNRTTVSDNDFSNSIYGNREATGIYSAQSYYATVLSNTFLQYDSMAVFAVTSGSLNLTDNDFYQFRSINISGSDGAYIIGNRLNNSNKSAIIIEVGSDGCLVQDNVILNSGEHGIFSSASRANSFIGNTVFNGSMDGIRLNSSANNTINNNTIRYNAADGLVFFNSSDNNVSYNFISFNLNGILLDNIGTASSVNNNISYNDLVNNTNWDLENMQSDTSNVAWYNWWGNTWAYYVDNNSIRDNEEVNMSEITFCPLLSSSISSGINVVDCVYPSVSLSLNTTEFIVAQDFLVTGLAVDSYFNNCTYKIANGANTWVSGTFDSVNKNFSAIYSGIYLPVGEWNFSANCSDQFSFSPNYYNSTNITSAIAIWPRLVGEASASATIGGSAVAFTFNVKSKGYKFTKFFMNLTSGINTYDVHNAYIGNGSNVFNISSSFDYSDANTYNLSDMSYVPAEYNYTSGLYEENLTLYISPYTGLSAGVYTGSYGWGLFDTY